MRSIELFAGAAGLGLGLAKAGFHHEIVVEHDAAACRTIRHNQERGHELVQGWKVVEADVESVDLSAVAEEPDLLAGGPPCQEFSLGGRHKGAEGERNMWPWTINATRVLRPRSFIFENVPGLASRHADYLEYLKMALTIPELANPTADWREDSQFLRTCLDQKLRSVPTYRVSVAKLSAADYGTAQKRSRLFIIGIRDDIAREWEAPEATHSAEQLLDDKWVTGAYWDRFGLARPDIDDAGLRHLRRHNQRGMPDLFAPSLAAHRTVRDAIGNLPEAVAEGSRDISDHEAAPREARAYKGHTGSPIDDPSKTLRAGVHGVSGGENMVDYGEGAEGERYRHFTVREAARVSGFPDDYVWPRTGDRSLDWGRGLKQLGNCVPTDLAEAVGRSVARAIAA